MATDPNFEAGAPMDNMGFDAPLQEPSQNTPAAAPAPPAKKLVDIYTAMLFVAALFLLAGSIALAWEKQRYGDLFGNSWKIPPDYKISKVENTGFRTDRFFRV